MVLFVYNNISKDTMASISITMGLAAILFGLAIWLIVSLIIHKSEPGIVSNEVAPPVLYETWTSNPATKIIGGTTADGEETYICRAEHNGVKHAGKVINNQCSFGYGGKEILSSKFEYLDTNKNVNWAANPANKIIADVHKGKNSYVCRVEHEGVKNNGKVHVGACNFGYKGKELRNTNFEYLGY